MRSPRLNLQKIEAKYSFADTPVFDREAGAIVRQHMRDYTNWARAERGFALMDEEKRFFMLLRPTTVDAAAESQSLSRHNLVQFSENACSLVEDTLETLRLPGLTNKRVRCLFVVEGQEFQLIKSTVISGLFRIPRTLTETVSADNFDDFWWGVTLPYDKEWECDFSVAQYTGSEIERVFGSDLYESGGPIIGVTTTFRPLPKIEHLKVGPSDWLADIAGRARDLAAGTLDDIGF